MSNLPTSFKVIKKLYLMTLLSIIDIAVNMKSVFYNCEFYIRR